MMPVYGSVELLFVLTVAAADFVSSLVVVNLSALTTGVLVGNIHVIITHYKVRRQCNDSNYK